jgi:hypothetical protein
MDSPGEWLAFTYHHKSKVGKNGAYTYLPADLEGKRVIQANDGDWEMHYKG